MFSLSLRPARMAWVCSIAAVLMCGTTKEAQAQPGAELVTDMQVTGVSRDTSTSLEGSFSGNITLTEIHFDASTTNTLIFIGNISGTATASIDSPDVVEQLFTTTGTLTALGGTKNKCGLLTLNLGTIDIPLHELQVEPDDISIDVAATRGKARNLGNQLCKLSRFIAKADVNKVNKVVNKIISIIKPPLANITVSGTANTSGSFTGNLTIDRMDVDASGNLSATGLISGVVSIDSLTTVVAGASFSTSATIYGTSFGGGGGCDTIFVDLGTITIPEQGLMLELNDMMVHTGATQGATKKAAKALCSIAKTLAKQEVKPIDTVKLVKKLTKQVVKLNAQMLP